MARPADPPGECGAQQAGQPGTEGRPTLIWSSLHTPAPDLHRQETSGLPAPWTTVPWTEAATLLGPGAACEVLWVVEPDPVHGPTPQALAEALQPCAGRAHTLVLLPQAWRDDVAPWLDAGADRCMPASSPAVLRQAMIHAMLRRCHGMAASVSVFGPLRFDHVSQTLFQGERRIWLTCRETQVAALLFRSSLQRTHAVDVLKALGAGAAQTANKALVSLYVHRVNRKIRPHGVQVDAVRGFGYRLRLITPSLRQTAISRPSVNGLTQWLRTSRPPTPNDPAVRP